MGRGVSPMMRGLPVRKPGRPKAGAGKAPMTLSRKVRDAIEVMVFEGVDRPTAAARVGLSDVTLRLAFSNPVVLAHHRERLEALRASERARNLHFAVRLRDDTLLEGAAGAVARLKGAQFIEGQRDGGQSVNVNISNQQVIAQAGYVVAIDPKYRDVPEVREYFASEQINNHSKEKTDVTQAEGS